MNENEAQQSESCRVSLWVLPSREVENTIGVLSPLAAGITQHASDVANYDLLRSNAPLYATIPVCTECMRDRWCSGGRRLVSVVVVDRMDDDLASARSQT